MKDFFASSKVALPLNLAFMDDFKLMAKHVFQVKILLTFLFTALTWARMEFRARKSCCMVIIAGKVTNQIPFTASTSGMLNDGDSGVIPFVLELPIKMLGRIIDEKLCDTQKAVKMRETIGSGLKLMDHLHHLRNE